MRASASRSAALERADLRDDIPRFVDRLVAVLDPDDPADRRDAVDPQTTGTHARHRLVFGVELRHLIEEYRLLRHTLMQHAMTHGCDLDASCFVEVIELNDMLDEAMAETVSAYARERDESRDLLLGVLGHDLRNPLTAVAVASSLLGETTSLEQVRAVGTRIKRSADRIQRVVADLLDLARSRFGVRMPIQREPVDLGELARLNVEELQLTHPGRQLIVEGRGDLSGSWDRGRVGQLVSNLVANALQHGSDPIRVTLEDEGATVVLRVANAGSPIPKASLPSLFDPFRRAAGDDKARLGLGLYIVAEVVRRHGGTVGVASTVEQTVFTVRLPRAAPP